VLLGQTSVPTSAANSDVVLYEVVFRRVYAMDKHRPPEGQRAQVEPLRTQFLPEANFTDEEIAHLKFVAADCVYQLYMISQEAISVLRNAKAPGAKDRIKELERERKRAVTKSIDELRRRFGGERFALFDSLIRKPKVPGTGAPPRGQMSAALESLPETCQDVNLNAHIWYDGSWVQGHATLSWSVPDCTSPSDGSTLWGLLKATMGTATDNAESNWGMIDIYLSSPAFPRVNFILAEAEFRSLSEEKFDAGTASDFVFVPDFPPPPPIHR
jgi:hypothetical protein